MSTTTVAFTTKRVEAASCPPDKNRVYFRDERSPLWLAVTRNGTKTFLVYARVDGKPTRVKLGTFPDLGVDAARKEAVKTAGKIAQGIDPMAARRAMRQGLTLREVFDDYVESYAKLRKKTWETDAEQFGRYLTAWHGRTLGEIQKTHVATLHAKIGKDHGIYAANRCLSLIHTLYQWAGGARGYEGSNPAVGVARFTEKKRERFLQPAELPAFFAAVEAEPSATVRDLVLILLYVGQRRGNTMAMAWDELDLDGATWQIPSTKNGSPVLVPLCEAAVEVLRRRRATSKGPFVFPGRDGGHLKECKRSFRNILKRAGIEGLRVHDLRRTFGSYQAIGGSSLVVIGKSLGHSSTASTNVYARLNLQAVRESVNAAVNAIQAAGKKLEGGQA